MTDPTMPIELLKSLEDRLFDEGENVDVLLIEAYHAGAARAALTELADGPAAVIGDPSDEELLGLMPQQFRCDLATVSRLAAHGAAPDVTPGVFRVTLNTGALEFARAVLARWGNHSADASKMVSPAEGEVAELVAWLREEAAEQSPGDSDGLPSDVRDYLADATARLTRAAALLERQAAPVPVAGPTFRDAIQLAQGCHDYSGGYGGTPCSDAFHAGIATVVSVLRKAGSGPWDQQIQIVFAVGKAHALPLPAQGGEVEP